MKEGETIFKSLCSTCHGEDARGVAVAGSTDGSMMGPALAGSPRVQGHRDYVIKTLLYGLTGPLAGQTYTQVMLPMGAQNDQWIANVSSYIRNEFGNSAPFITPAEVARVRTATANRKSMWTYPELEVSLPRLLPVDPIVEGDRQSQQRACGERSDARRLDDRHAAGTGHVVPGRTAAAGDGHRSAVRCRPAGWRWPRSWRPRRLPVAVAPACGTAPAGAPAAATPAPGRRRRLASGPPRFGSYPLATRFSSRWTARSWSPPVAEGAGSPAMTVATFRPTQAKFVRVTQTGTAEDAPAWSILNFRVYSAGGGSK